MNRKVCLILGLHETSLLPDTYGTPALLLSQETSWVLIHVWLTISREPCSQTWEHGGRLPILYTTCAIIRRAERAVWGVVLSRYRWRGHVLQWPDLIQLPPK